MSSNITGANQSRDFIPLERGTGPVETEASRTNVKSVDTERELERAISTGENVPISEQQLIKAIEKAVKAIQGPNTQLEFSVHEQTKRIMVKVMNKESGEIIREIPPEKSMDLLVSLWEMAGILVDERR